MTTARFAALARCIESDIESNFDRADSEQLEFALLRLLERYRKKFSCSHTKALESSAIDAFVSTNQAVSELRCTLTPYERNNAALFIRHALERFTSRFEGVGPQEVLFRPALHEMWRYGPGASNGVVGTHAVDKACQTPSVTMSSLPEVVKLYSSDPYLRLFLEDRPAFTVVSGSRLSTVPKNEEKARTIAIEPLANMQLQLAAGAYIEGALRCIGLDIRTQQPKNKRLAERGSRDGSLSTLDMKSASDMISIELVQLLWPREWVSFLSRIRSPFTELPDGRQVKLSMISTMGNGFTFPLMTLTLLALIYASQCNRGWKGRPFFVDYNDVAVFGDDLIVPTSAVESVIDIVERAGFVINRDKSYTSGPFRESCGGDYFKGYDVTPFYLKSLSCDAEIFVCLNQVLRYCVLHGVLFPATLLYLKSLLRGPVLFVPEWHGDTAGVRTAACPRRYRYLRVTPKAIPAPLGSRFGMMFVLAGWVNQVSAKDPFYVPRPYKTRYRIKAARLPSGYLDGFDPMYLGRDHSSCLSLYAATVLS